MVKVGTITMRWTISVAGGWVLSCNGQWDECPPCPECSAQLGHELTRWFMVHCLHYHYPSKRYIILNACQLAATCTPGHFLTHTRCLHGSPGRGSWRCPSPGLTGSRGPSSRCSCHKTHWVCDKGEGLEDERYDDGDSPVVHTKHKLVCCEEAHLRPSPPEPGHLTIRHWYDSYLTHGIGSQQFCCILKSYVALEKNFYFLQQLPLRSSDSIQLIYFLLGFFSNHSDSWKWLIGIWKCSQKTKRPLSYKFLVQIVVIRRCWLTW